MDFKLLTSDEPLNHFIKDSEQIARRVKLSETTYVKGPQSSEEDLVLRGRDKSMTESQSVISYGNKINHSPNGQVRN